MSIAAGLAIAYQPMRLLTRGRKGFYARLNSKAASQASADLGMENYRYRRELLAYFLAEDECPLIFGHYPFSEALHAKYSEEWKFVTLVRDPVQRWYSEYNWNRFKDHAYGKTDLDVEAYLEGAQGRKDARSYVNFFTEADDPSARAQEAEAARAIAALEKFAVVGVLKDLPRFSEDLGKVFGRKPLFFKRNKSPASEEQKVTPDPDSDFHKTLLEHLAADIAIYEHVQRRLAHSKTV